MHTVIGKHRTSMAGFTRTELLVVLGVGAILSGVMGADLNQAKSKLLQQACAANLKQWGMAIDLYAQDYNGSCYYISNVINFDDTSSPYGKYIGGTNPLLPIPHDMMRTIRYCPEVASRMTQNQILGTSLHTYSMPIPMVLTRGAYQNYDSSPGVDLNNMFFPLKKLSTPSRYLLMIDSGGHTMHCIDLASGTIGNNSVPASDTVRAIDRHGGGVNCLFGDFHVEFVSQSTVAQHAANCGNGDQWFLLQ